MNIAAHRASWEMFRGDIPPGIMVLHTCDYKRCVNPHHLFLGTHRDNMDDMAAKGRSSTGDHRGQNNGRAIITWDMVRQIRTRYSDGVRVPELAREFPIKRSQLYNIVAQLDRIAR